MSGGGSGAAGEASDPGVDAGVDALPVPALVVDRHVVTAANTIAVRLLDDLVAGDLVDRPLTELFGLPDEPGVETPTIARLGEGPGRKILELRFGPVRPDGTRFVVLLDITAERLAHRIAAEIANATSIVDMVGQRHFGPIGREIKEGTEVPGSVADRVHPEDIGRALDAYVQVRETPGSRAALVVRAMDPLLEGRWAEARIQIINQLADPDVQGLITSIDSIELTEDVESIARTSSSYLSVAAAAPVGIVLTGPQGFAVYFNEAAQRLIPGVGVGDRDRDWIGHASEEDQPRLRQMLEDTPRTGEWHSTVARFEPGAGPGDGSVEEPGDGGSTWLLVTIAPRLVEDDRVIGMVITLQDVSGEIRTKHELEDARQRLLHLATHDPLTGLANRAHLTEELALRLEAAVPGSSSGSSLAVLFCDLDGFKSINDGHGHGVGDAVLAEVGTRLRHQVEDPDLVARFGGDEFVVLTGRTGGDLDALADRLSAAVAEPIEVGALTARLGVSIGVATAEPGDTADQLLSRADHAMYAAKAAARS